MTVEKHPRSLEKLELATQAHGFNMPSDRQTGRLLATLCAAKPGGRILEMGTGTGLATCWMLWGMDERSTLLTVDNDPAVVAIAKQFVSDDRVTFLVEDGLAAIRRLPPGSQDLIFADAMPGKYEGFETTIGLLKPGGVCVLDDMLPQSNWPEGHQSRVDALMDDIAGNLTIRSVFLHWSTGIMLCTKVA